MDFVEYRRIDAVNWSTLKHARRSLKHYQWHLSHEDGDTDAMRLGRAAHCAIFEPDRFPLDFAVWAGGQRRGKDWDKFQEAHVGQTIIRLDEYAACLSMREAVKEHPVAGPLLETGKPEHVIQWKDEETGLDCKARLDWLGPSVLLDLKTTNTLEPGLFANTSARMGHHMQLAFYAMGLRALGIEVPVKVLGVESSDPHDVGVFRVTEDVLWAAELDVRELLAKVASAKFSGLYPGRFTEETDFRLPAWAMPEDTEDDLTALGLVAEAG